MEVKLKTQEFLYQLNRKTSELQIQWLYWKVVVGKLWSSHWHTSAWDEIRCQSVSYFMVGTRWSSIRSLLTLKWEPKTNWLIIKQREVPYWSSHLIEDDWLSSLKQTVFFYFEYLEFNIEFFSSSNESYQFTIKKICFTTRPTYAHFYEIILFKVI